MLNALGEPSIPKSYRKAVNDSPRTQNASRWCDDSRKLHSKTKQKWSRATLKDCSPLSPTASQPPTQPLYASSEETTRTGQLLELEGLSQLPLEDHCHQPDSQCASKVFLCVSVFSPGYFFVCFSRFPRTHDNVLFLLADAKICDVAKEGY